MSLEQVIAENNKILISIRDLLLSGNLPAAPKVEAEQKTPPKPAKKVQAKPVEDKPEDKPEESPKAELVPAPAQPAQVPETAMPATKTEPTEQEAIQCLLDLAKKDRNAAVTVLAQFGAGKAIDVPLEKRAEFIDALKSKLAEIAGV